MFVTLVAGMVAVLSTMIPARADPGSDGKTGPPTAAVAPTGRPCVERSGESGGGPVGCLGVRAVLDRAPAVGATATLTVTVRASVKLAPTDIKVELPTQLVWVQAPAGFAAGQETSVLPERSGSIATAQRRLQLVAGQPVTFTGVLRAVAPGYGQLQVRAIAPNGSDADAGQDDVFLTIGDRNQPSHFGAVATKGDLSVATSATAPNGVAVRPAWQEPRSVGTAGLPVVSARRADGTALVCDTRATGNWSYTDAVGVRHNAMNFQVQVRDLVRGTLALGLTDGGGNFNLCFDSSVGTQLYVTLVSEVAQWRVQNGTDVYNWSTAIVRNPVPGSTVNFGAMSPADAADNRAAHAFDEANDTWLFIPKVNSAACFDQKETVCRQVRINWSRDSAHRTEYNLQENVVYLAANDPNEPIVVAHEIGHAVMDDVYNDAFPAAPNCTDHQIDRAYSAGCAWTEGFADWFALSVYRTSVLRWPTGQVLDMEGPSWGNGWAQGDTAQARVIGAMIDIGDSTNEPLWDRSAEGTANLWNTFVKHIDPDFRSFWNHRDGDGFDVADTGALASLYQNTIDFGFREPLSDKVLMQRSNPTPHNFSFRTSKAYWSVVGLLPNGTTDDDLSLLDDRAGSISLGGSTFGGSTIDFVAIDSNRRTFGDYYPRVSSFMGTDSYYIEVALGGDPVLAARSSTLVKMPNDFVAVRDTPLTAGIPVTLTITPNSSGQDVDIFLMGDDPNIPATFIRNRAAAVATGASGGAGVRETITYTPTVSGWYGVIITQRSAVGNVTLTRS